MNAKSEENTLICPGIEAWRKRCDGRWPEQGIEECGKRTWNCKPKLIQMHWPQKDNFSPMIFVNTMLHPGGLFGWNVNEIIRTFPLFLRRGGCAIFQWPAQLFLVISMYSLQRKCSVRTIPLSAPTLTYSFITSFFQQFVGAEKNTWKVGERQMTPMERTLDLPAYPVVS